MVSFVRITLKTQTCRMYFSMYIANLKEAYVFDMHDFSLYTWFMTALSFALYILVVISHQGIQM